MTGVSARLAPAANAAGAAFSASPRRTAPVAIHAATREEEHAVSTAAEAPVAPRRNERRPHVALDSFPVPVNAPGAIPTASRKTA